MKRQETINPGSMAVLEMTLDNGAPFQVNGQVEALQDVMAVTAEYDKTRKPSLGNVAVKAVEAPQPVVNPKPEYVSLADLSDREIARRSLKAFRYDILTLGRNNEYKRFKARVAEEKDAATDMELGIVQAVHCRLHEKMIARAKI